MSRASTWRDEAAGALLAKHARRLPTTGRALVMGDPRDEAARALEAAGLSVDRWWRRAYGGRPASAWPPAGPFDLVALRLPKAKDELEMAVHGAAASLGPGSTLAVYGAKDEGIGSANRRISPLLGPVQTLATGGHCRVLTARRPAVLEGLRGHLSDWRHEVEGWVSYPGLFAHGRVDRGTALLLDHLPDPVEGDRILDFGCGSGVLTAGCIARARDRGAAVSVHGLDVDAVALVALTENVPEVEPVLADGLTGLPDSAFTLIVSNPPYHAGKAESVEALRSFLEEAPRVLASGGRIALVTQRRLPVGRLLERHWERPRSVADVAPFRVWTADRS